MTPWEQLAGALQTLGHTVVGLPAEQPHNVYRVPPGTVMPPAIVLRPDFPWVDPRQRTYTQWHERYVAICCSSASDPISAVNELYGMARAVIAATAADGWDWTEVGGVVLDDTTGTPLLTTAVKLTYDNERSD